MSELAFFDTNVLVYCDDAAAPDKQNAAISVFQEHQRLNTAVLSLQVLQEYFVTVTRKLGLAADLAQRKVELLSHCRLVYFTAKDVIAAIELHRLNRLSFWDAMIVHAARVAGCAVLYSEDLHDGSVIGGVRVINPFATK